MDTEQVTETETAETERLFNRYCENEMPPHLQGPAAPGSIGLEADRAEHIATCRRRWNQLLHQGYTPREAAGVDDAPGEVLGQARRPLAGTLTADTVARARAVKRDVDARKGAGMEDIGLDILNRAARGDWSSAAITAENTIAQAESAVRAHDARLATAARERAALIRVEVRAICGPGRCYVGDLKNVRTYDITAEALEALEKWAEIMWANRRGREYPEPYNSDTWPPFRVVEAVAV